MKKKIFSFCLILAAMLMLFALVSCGDKHTADCDTLGHTYTETVTKRPTTFETGTVIRSCDCGHSYEETLPATRSLKILAIGNSFSADAMRWLYIVCKDAGIETVLLGNLYKGASTLDEHLSYMENNSANYKFYLSDAEMKNVVLYKDGATALEGIEYADWDFITLQQGSSKSGIADSYSYLEGVIDYVNEHKNADAQLFWHMTWAYQGDSTHAAVADYNRNQLTMYNGILSCVQQEVLAHSDIKGVIPSGTTIQNLRNSHLGDTLTRDGYHLSYDIGRYAAALTYLAAITGYDVSNITVVPSNAPAIGDHLPCIKEAVANAIAKPYEITPLDRLSVRGTSSFRHPGADRSGQNVS